MICVSHPLRSIWCFGLALVALTVFVSACSKTESVSPPTVDPPTVNDVVVEAGWFPPAHPDSNSHAIARYDSTGTDLRCTIHEGYRVVVATRLTHLEPRDDIHHAGSILQWASLDQVSPLLVEAERAGATLRLVNADSVEVAGEISMVTPDMVDTWRQETLAELGMASPDSWSVEIGPATSTEMVAQVTGINNTATTQEFRDRLAFTPEPLGRAVVRLQRTHHRLSCDWPGNAGAAFAPGVMGADVEDQMAEGNPPVWLYAAEHGELLVFVVEAEADHDEVVAAAVNTFSAAATGLPPTPGEPLLHDLLGLTVKVFALGADADAAEIAGLTDLSSLTDFLQAPPVDPASLPAVSSYLQALRNGGPLSRELDATFEYITCKVYDPVFEGVFFALEAADARTEVLTRDLETDGHGNFYYDGGSNRFTNHHVESIPDLVGSGGRATPNGRMPVIHYDMLNGHPVVELMELSPSQGTIHSELTFDGSALVGESYTLFIVVGQPYAARLTYTVPGGTVRVPRRNDVNYFFHGTGTGNLHNLMIGYPDYEQMIYSHYPYLLQYDHSRPGFDNEWHVYAFRFSLNSGMAAYVDGVMVDHDTSDSHALLEFSNATICARWYEYSNYSQAVIYFAELAAYDEAGTNDQIAAESQRLMDKYGLTAP